jgi:hypothetical protein
MRASHQTGWTALVANLIDEWRSWARLQPKMADVMWDRSVAQCR